MNLDEQLRILEAAQVSPGLLTLSAVDLVSPGLPEAERARLKEVLLAAAVPHWCDRDFLAALLKTEPTEAGRLLTQLRPLTAVEAFPARGEDAVNVHETARLALRDHLRTTDAARWRDFSARASVYLRQSPAPHARVEALYHLFAVDPQAAMLDCEELSRDLAATERPEVLSALGPILKELAEADWLDQAARAAAGKLEATIRNPPTPTDMVARARSVDTRSVYVSYCHESPEHLQAVHSLAARLREAGLPVEFDQMYLTAHPNGPEEGWAKWSEDRATESEAVLAVASPGWFAAYEQRGSPDTGLGSAAEARVFRQKIYHNLGRNARVRFVELATSGRHDYPPSLSGWHRFRLAERPEDFPAIVAWLKRRLAITSGEEPQERAVYLAETLPEASGLISGLRGGLAEELADRGWMVLPGQAYAASDYAGQVRRDLRRVVAFIQILQLEREAGSDRDFIQYLEAMELGVKCLRYRDPDLNLARVEDFEKRAFLSSDPNIRPIQFDEFKKDLFRVLEQTWARREKVPEPVPPSTARAPRLVRVVVDRSCIQEWRTAVSRWLERYPDILVEDFEIGGSESLIRKHRALPCQGLLFLCNNLEILDESLEECVEIQLDLKDKAPPVGIFAWGFREAASRPLPIKRHEFTVPAFEEQDFPEPEEVPSPPEMPSFIEAVREIPI